ncbi:MAG: hypothetical protein AABZ25_07200, partial [Nitrospirota bacterium]
MTEQYKWTQAEKVIARRVFDRAYKRECTNILKKVKEMLSKMENPKEIWKIEEYLNKERMKIERKYDYRYSVLIIVFGQLIRDGLIEKSDLQG